MEQLVSVIIPTYNRAYTVMRAINSVLRQSYRNLELIIVDDNSSDGTEQIVRSIEDCRIMYIKHNVRRGGAAARNTGIKLAQGEYIAFQDSDDEWMPNKLLLQMSAMLKAETNVGVIYSSFIRIDKYKEEIIPRGNARNLEGDIFKRILRNNFITTQTTLIARKCFDKVGLFDDSLPRLQDWELWLRISRQFKFLYIPQPLVIAYIQRDSISTSVSGLLTAIEIIHNKYNKEFLEYDPFSIANKYCWLGRALVKEGRIKEGLDKLSKSIQLYPFGIKFKIIYLLYMMKYKRSYLR